MATHAAVNENRRTTFRRMAQMNEDRLTSLRNPPRAEATRRVLGHLESHNAVLKKQLNLWYKEQNFALNKLNRGQNKVYKTFLRVNYEQKKLERLTQLKKRQQELAEKLVAESRAREEALEKKEATQKQNRTSKVEHTDEVKKEIHPVQKEKVGQGTTVHGEAVVNESKTTVKKYNRHRSEFEVVVNPPTTIQVPAVNQDGVAMDPNIEKEKSEVRRMRAKVLVVRKQSDLGPNNKNETFDVDQSLTRDKSKSFLMERSGSFFIQTVLMANKQPDPPELAEKGPGEGGSEIKVNTQPVLPAIKSEKESDKKDSNVDASMTNTQPTPTTNKKEIKLTIKGAFAKGDKKVNQESGDQFLFEKVTNGHDKKKPDYSLGELRTTRSLYKKPPPSTSYSYSALEEERQRQRRSHAEFVGRQGARTPLAESALSSPKSSTRGGKMTIAKYNKWKRKERERIRKDILEGEVPILYEKNEKGELMLSEDDFKRREFKKPSSAEQKNRIRLLHQSRVDVKVGASKVSEYIDKLSEQERQERMEREKRLRQKAQEEAAARAEAEKQEAMETDPGVLLRSLIKAFKKGDLEPDVDPNSVDSLQKCDYIRLYDKSPEEQQGRRVARRKHKEKLSSWNQGGRVVHHT